MASTPVEVLHFTDPSCPWAYSAEPFMRSLEYRYGDGLRWREVMIGLSEDTVAAERRGLTPTRRLRGWQTFGKRFGMPVGLEPRSRMIHSGRACRAVVSARQQSPELGTALLRAIRLAWFTSILLLDEDDGLREAAAGVPGLDAERTLAGIDTAAVEEAYQADRAETRSADANGRPAIVQEKTATAGEGERFTAPSLVFQRDGQRLVAGGWQPLHAYDVCVANLAPDLPRRPEPRVPEALEAFPGGLTTQEVARLCAMHDDDPDREAAMGELASLCGAGQAERIPLGDDAIWRVRG